MSRPRMDWCQLKRRPNLQGRQHAVQALELVRAVANPLCSAAVALLDFDACPRCPVPVAICLRVGLQHQLASGKSLEVYVEVL